MSSIEVFNGQDANKLEELISQNFEIFNLSTIDVFRTVNQIQPELFSNELKYFLTIRRKELEKPYSETTLHRVQNLLSVLTNRHSSWVNFSKICPNGLNAESTGSYDEVKEYLREWNRRHPISNLDERTLTALNSSESLQTQAKGVHFGVQKGQESMILTRGKRLDSLDKKLRSKFERAGDCCTKEEIRRFIYSLAEDPSFFHYLAYHPKSFSSELLSLLADDVVGFKYVMPGKKLNELAKNFERMKRARSDGLVVIPSLCDDHRERLKQNRPGGLYFGVFDHSLGYLQEIQIVPRRSEVYNLCGEAAHFRYKKAS